MGLFFLSRIDPKCYIYLYIQKYFLIEKSIPAKSSSFLKSILPLFVFLFSFLFSLVFAFAFSFVVVEDEAAAVAAVSGVPIKCISPFL